MTPNAHEKRKQKPTVIPLLVSPQQAMLITMRKEQRAALLQLRKLLGLSQEQLAQRLSVSSKSVFRYEKGSDAVSLGVALKLLNIINNAPGLEPCAAWWKLYIAGLLKAKTGLGGEPLVPVMEQKAESKSGARAAELLRTLLELWNVFQPQMNAGEARIHARISELLTALTNELMPEKQTVEPKH